MWRVSSQKDDADIIEMSLSLYTEDPPPMPVPEQHTQQTLSILRAEPARGRAVVLDLNETIAGYALLIGFWSNELGGEIIIIDELYVRPSYRNQGHGRRLIQTLVKECILWPGHPVALELEVTPGNQRAAALYAELGFKPAKNARMRLTR